MKIRKLVFNNINNLKDGPHVVSFDQEPLSTAGIFAIVGPTGSGKSTILDVVTLASFNRVPRLPSISDRRIEKDGSIITHFAKQADAAITYQVGRKVYTSKWNIRVASSGKVQPYHMELLDEGGNIIAERSAVPAKNEAIIGLNYDQFVKSIILSQGDFSRFLKAKKEERSELLERLTGSLVYRKVGKAAFQRNKEVQQTLDNEKSMLSEIRILSVEDLESLHKDKDQATNAAVQIEAEIKKQASLRNTKLAIQALQSKITAKKAELLKVEKETEDFKLQDALLEMHTKVSLFTGELKLYENGKRNLTQTKIEIDNLEKDILSANSDLTSAINGLKDLTGKAVDRLNFRDVMDDYESEVVKLDNKLSGLKSRGGDTRNRIHHIIQNTKLNFDAQLKPGAALAQLEKEEAEQAKIIGDFTENIEDAQLRLQVMRSNLAVLQSLKIFNEGLQITKREGEEQEKLITQYKVQYRENQKLLEKQKALTKVLSEKASLLSKQKEDALKIAKLEDLRDQLINGEACPLCGSLEHPYTKHFDAVKPNAIDQIIIQNEVELKSEEVVLRNLLDSTSSINTGQRIAEKHLSDLKSKLTEIQNSIDQEKDKYQGEPDAIGEGAAKLAEDLQKEVISLKLKIDAFAAKTMIADLMKEFALLKEIGDAFTEIRNKRNALYQGSDVKKDCNLLQDRFINAATRVEKSDGLLAEKHKNLLQIKNDLTTVSKQLADELPALGVNSIDDMSALLLSDNQFLTMSKRKQKLKERSIALSAELEQSDKDFQDANKSDYAPEQTLENLELKITSDENRRNGLNAKIGEIKSQINFDSTNRKSQEARLANIAMLEKESAKWSLLNKMIGSKNGDKFANFAQDLTLKNLLVYTNIRLQDLTDRYLLDMPGDNGSMTVVDLYQGNTERTVTTLSGGEIFILSLALAISLSDMASQNIALESLFIDEGFGTLDQETLDIAMSTLEKLQSENRKMIGVISHVEALKERITVQVQLKKNAQGYSKIEVV